MFACSNLKLELIVRLHEIDYSSILITRIIMINMATYIALVCTQVVELCHVGTVDKKNSKSYAQIHQQYNSSICTANTGEFR